MALTKITGEGTGSLDSLTTTGALDVTTSTHANASVFKSTGNTQIMLQDTDASANDQFWGLQVSGGDFNILTCNDDRASGFSTPFYIKQAGTIVSSSGIAIGGTGAANTLDDYEEGTWTATLEGSTSNPSSTVQTTSARYTKIGRQVFAQGAFSNVDTTGAAGAPRVTGLPFSASTSFATGNVMLYSRFAIGTTAANVSPYVAGTTIFFYQSTNVQGWAEVAHSAGTGAYFAFTVVYDV